MEVLATEMFMSPDTGPSVSVLMPAYNHEQFVEQAVRSVWRQSYKNIELVAIDDGSSDGTLKVLKDLSVISPIPMQVHTQANQGLCRTLNRCIKNSSGEWIAILASDDQYRENFIQRMVSEAAMHLHDSTVLHCDAIGIDEQGNGDCRLSRIRKVPPLKGDVFYAVAYGRGFIISSTMFLSRKLLERVGPYDTELRAEDFDMHLRLARLARFVYLDEPLFLARKLAGSLGSRRRVWSDDIFVALAKHKDYLGVKYKKVVTLRHVKLAKDYYADLDFTGSAHQFRAALKSTPPDLFIVTLMQMLWGFVCSTPRILLLAILPASGARYARAIKRWAISNIRHHD